MKYSFSNNRGGECNMEGNFKPLLEISEGIHAESKLREAGYMMGGHHCHTHYELFYVENGSCRFLIENSMYDLHAGDFMLIPPLTLHYTRYLFGACKRSVLFFRRKHLTEFPMACMPGGEAFFSETQLFQVPPAHQELAAAHIARMVTEEKISDSRSAALLGLQLQELLLYCSRVCVFLHDTPDRIYTTDQQVLHAARFIISHYMNPITTADIAAASGFSANYLSRKFKEAAGIGLHEYLMFIRLQHAALELVSTGDSITEIALRCGFSDSNYFKDVFKRKYGMTPRSYRKIS